jgi:hypothetical protein
MRLTRSEATAAGGYAARAGLVGIAGAILWIVGLAIEYPYELQPPAAGWLFYVDQLVFAAAMLGWLAAIAGLAWLRVAGRGKGRSTLIAWGTGIALLVLGSLISLSIRAAGSDAKGVYDNNPLFPLGGLLQLLGSMAAGVVIARAGRLEGWRRWAVLAYAVYYVVGLFMPLVLGYEPNFVTEAVWGAAWIVVGLATISAARSVDNSNPRRS